VAALFREASDDVVRRKPAPEKWSMLEILCHLRDVEQLFVERYGKIANHDRPQLRMIDQDALATKLRYNEDAPAVALREFQAFRAETVALLSALAQQSWERRFASKPTTAAPRPTRMHAAHDVNHLGCARSGAGRNSFPGWEADVAGGCLADCMAAHGMGPS
jgi:hypothetical protein